MSNYLEALKKAELIPSNFQVREIGKATETCYLILLISVKQDEIDPEKTSRKESQAIIPMASFREFSLSDCDKIYLLHSPEPHEVARAKYERVLKKHYGEGEKWQRLGKPAMEAFENGFKKTRQRSI